MYIKYAKKFFDNTSIQYLSIHLMPHFCQFGYLPNDNDNQIFSNAFSCIDGLDTTSSKRKFMIKLLQISIYAIKPYNVSLYQI